MAKTDTLPPILFPTKDDGERKRLLQFVKEGRVQKIGPRLYTSVPEQDVNQAVRDSWATIVSNLYPSALISHRSALEYQPTPDGLLMLTSTTNRVVAYPGLTLHFMRGPSPRKDDLKFMQLHASSLARALLENLSTSHEDGVQKNLPQVDIEQKLEHLLLTKGEAALNELRDHARLIAKDLSWPREFDRLHKLIGGMLGTKSAKDLKSTHAKARAVNMAYDTDALRRLQVLFAELRHHPFNALGEENRKHEHVKNKAFFEAYFSNYIEGTTFEIEEAEEIIFDKKIPKNRPEDAHDVMGIFQIVSNLNEMTRIPTDFDHFIQLLKERHFQFMEGRHDALPGLFKEKPNRAGSTSFVHPDYVIGTMAKGFELYSDLPIGMARSIFIMFLVTEVHPFVDGNGRLARIMMNVELCSAGLSTIIIPTVYREDYLSSLRALTRRERAQPLIKMLNQAQAFSHLNFANYRASLETITNRNWFLEPDDGKIIL